MTRKNQGLLFGLATYIQWGFLSLFWKLLAGVSAYNTFSWRIVFTVVTLSLIHIYPNWGRILAAVGYAGVDVPVDNVDIMIGGLPVMLASSPVTFDDEEMKDIMHGNEVTITVDLHSGQEKGTAWGCDLSYDYVKINALYHT